MAGYKDTRELIINTLMGRPVGTEIQPEDHQRFALQITEYIRSVELVAGNSTPIGFADASTVPVQPDNGQAVYLASVESGKTATFANFIDQSGNAISVSSTDSSVKLVTLLWNGRYWSSQVTSIKVVSSGSGGATPDIPLATQSSSGLMSAEDKTKLDGMDDNANNYTHPAGSAASKSLGLYKISTDSTSHVKSVSAVTKSDITSLGIPAQDTTYNNATQSTAGLMSAEDKTKLDNLDTSGTVSDTRALNGATMRFSGFVNGVTITQTGVNEWDSVVYDTAVNKFLAKKNNGTLSPTYHNIWSGMDAYMSDEIGTSVLKDKLYIYGEDVYVWSDTEGTLVKVTSENSGGGSVDIPLATQSAAGLMSAEDKTKLDNVISRVVLSEFSERKFFSEFPKVTGASAIGWAGALFIDDFSSSEYRDFYCCMTYGQGIVIRHTYKTGVYEYLNSFMVDSSTTSSSYSITNKMNSGGWGKYYDNSELPLAYISRCSPNASYIHTYYAYKINRSVTPFAFERVLTIKYGGSKLAAITSDITIDAEKKYLYVHGYKSGSADAITGTSIVMVFNLPEPGSSDTITLNDSDILWEFEFFVNEAAQDLCVSGGKLYYPYGSGSLHGLAVIDTETGKIIQNLDLSTLSTNFIDNPEPEGVALSNGNVYLNYHHAGTNNNEVCLVEFPLQEVKEALKVPTKVSQLENDANYLTGNKDILESGIIYDISKANNMEVYNDLSSALGVNGGNIPASIRAGGLSIKFVARINVGTQDAPSYSNEYVQYRLRNEVWSINVSDWMFVGELSTNTAILLIDILDKCVYTEDMSQELSELRTKIVPAASEELPTQITVYNMGTVKKQSEGSNTWIEKPHLTAGTRIKETVAFSSSDHNVDMFRFYGYKASGEFFASEYVSINDEIDITLDADFSWMYINLNNSGGAPITGTAECTATIKQYY